MWRHGHEPGLERTVLIIVAQLGLSALLATQVSAETGESSWLKRQVPQTPQRKVPAAKVPRKAKGQGVAKTTAPGQPKRIPLGKTMVEPSGEDAAYIAFDQGQYLTALRLAEARAKEKDPQAHTLIGRLYAEGLGVPINKLTAAKWYRRGAELGDIEAMFAFGVILAKGKAVKQDHNGAADMFERAARKGHAYAHYNLGLLFLSGKGKPENPFRGAQHLEYAARQGIPEAQYDLAALYQQGSRGQSGCLSRVDLVQNGRRQGARGAQYEYAVVLLRGHGINADRPKIHGVSEGGRRQGRFGCPKPIGSCLRNWNCRGSEGANVAAAKWRMVARDGGFKDKELDAVIAKYPKKVLAAARSAATNYRNRAFVGLGLATQR